MLLLDVAWLLFRHPPRRLRRALYRVAAVVAIGSASVLLYSIALLGMPKVRLLAWLLVPAVALEALFWVVILRATRAATPR
jgi:hypothetical protein